MKLSTTVIGSYPKPSYLTIPDWFKYPNMNSCQEYDNYMKNTNVDNLMTLIDKARKEVINEQIDLGIDVITDGELTRDNYIYGFCRNLDGIDFNTLTVKSIRNGVYTSKCPTIISKISSNTYEPYLYKEWMEANEISEKPIKSTIPGPMTIVDTLSNEYYENEEDICIDLSKVINKELHKLVEMRRKYVQIDEPVFARYPEKTLKYGIKMLDKCLEGIPEEIDKIVHICCGYPEYFDQKGYIKADPKNYHILAPYIEKSLANMVSIEDAHCHSDLSFLKYFKKTKVILGCIDISSSKIESVEDIRSRVMKALKYVDGDNLILAPDCGLGMLPKDILIRKIKNMVAASKSFK